MRLEERGHREDDRVHGPFGRTMAQPIRSSGWRPLTSHSNARGTSGTRPGKRCAMSGGGVPDGVGGAPDHDAAGLVEFRRRQPRRPLRRRIEQQMRTRRYPARSGPPAADRRRPRAAAGWCAAQNCRRRNARSRAAGSDVGTSALPVHGRNSVAAIATSAGAAIGGGPDRAQHALTAQMNQIAGRDDDGKPRHQQRDARTADDAVEIEQAARPGFPPAPARWQRNRRIRAPADRPAAGR